MRLSDVRAEVRPLKVEFPAGVLQVEYRPNTFSVDAVNEIQQAMLDPAKQTNEMFRMISEMLASWDLEDDDGKPIELTDTKKVRAEVPMGIFGKIFAAIRNDQETQSAGKASSGG